MKRRRLTLALAAVALAGLSAASVLAATSVTISGTRGNDRLVGTKGNDVINGRVGNDTISGLAGNDTLNGGPGNDRMTGGPGADTIICGPGKDTVVADAKDRIAADCENGVPKPTVSVGDASVAEGNSGTTTLSFPVTLSGPTTKAVSVGYSTSDGSATAGTDYVAATGTVTFTPGTTSKTIDVAVSGDTAIEPDETLTVQLSNPVNATIGSGSAAGTVSNDDKGPHAGHYTGQTSQGKPLSFDVAADGISVTNLSFTVDLGCASPPELPISLGGPFSIAADRSVAFNFSAKSSPNILAGTVKASFDAADAASGTLSVFDAVNTSSGAVICSTGTLTWKAA